jgi:nicotinamide phosphoribosyltransferase
MKINPVLTTDFYKVGHIDQYPDNTQYIFSNFTCRSDKYFTGLPNFDHKAVFFGMQGIASWYLQDLWEEHFFGRSKNILLDEYKDTIGTALGIVNPRTDHIEALHDLQYLPIRIKALPEGSRVNMRVPLWTIRNTLPEFFWLTNYLETPLSAEQWKVMTSATTSFEFRRLFRKYANITGTPMEFVEFQGHDFSARGMSGIYDFTQNGAGHLLSFSGTDTVSSLKYVKDYYFGKGFIGGSVPATEHSVMCAGGQVDEIQTFSRLLDIYPEGIVSIVSDTWDFWKVLTEYAVTLKEKILNRKPNAIGLVKTVFRPDSGDPVKIICGDAAAAPGSPEWKGAVECLWDVFGGETNAKGYKVLNPKVGLIYGDSITLQIAQAMLEILERKKFATGCIVLGIGSYTYQHVTRDTLGSAIKATHAVINGESFDLMKKPKTDSGVKNSASGLLRIEKDDAGNFVLHENQTSEQEKQGLLRTVFEDGKRKLENMEDFTTIRDRLRESDDIYSE